MADETAMQIKRRMKRSGAWARGYQDRRSVEIKRALVQPIVFIPIHWSSCPWRYPVTLLELVPIDEENAAPRLLLMRMACSETSPASEMKDATCSC